MRRWMYAAPLALAAACSGQDGDDTAAVSSWLTSEQNLGAARVGSPTADLREPDALWAQLGEVIPFLSYDDPANEVPFFAWTDLALSERVADEGTCPDVQAVNRTTTWETYGCRSSQGYEWTGNVSKEEWEEGDWRYARWDFDLDVMADVEDPRFETLGIEGSVVYVIGDGDILDHAVRVNATTHLDGYWERQNQTDPREELWTDWNLTARYEQDASGTFQMEGAAQLGDHDAFAFSSSSLRGASGCATVPDGTLTLRGQQEATLAFTGSQGCSTCADLSVDGETSALCKN